MMKKLDILLPTLATLITLSSVAQSQRTTLGPELVLGRDYDPGYQSVPCQINVNCPLAAGWEEQVRSTVMFIRPDGGGCTGVLMNNSNEDGTPYVLTANHCAAGDPSLWTFYFNYESPNCVGDTGPTDQSITGASIVASNYYRDFALLELSSMPPASFKPFYSGWDISDSPVSSGAIIMHPAYDVKKIAFENDAFQKSQVSSIDTWNCYLDTGVVQFVASGSGLWDQDHRVVGYLVDGIMDCSNSKTVAAQSIRLKEAWVGNWPSDRIQDRLDPSGTMTTLDGFDPYLSTASGLMLDLRVSLQGPYDPVLNEMRADLNDLAMIPLTEPYTALGYTQIIGGGETTTIPILENGSSDDVVDWILLELRSVSDPTSILETRNVLLQKNGRTCTAAGDSVLAFQYPSGYYYIAVRHRNHLGVMTAAPVYLETGMVASVNFMDGSTATFGTDAQRLDMSSGSAILLNWAGDVNLDGQLSYTGSNNDRDPILVDIGGNVPTNTDTGYRTVDVNMDGTVQYTGLNNDRDPILVNVGGNLPTATRQEQLP